MGKLRVVTFGGKSSDPEIMEHSAHYYDSIRRGLAFDVGLGFKPDLSDKVTPQALIVHRRGYRGLLVNGTEVPVSQ